MRCNLQRDSKYYDFPELQCSSGKTLKAEKYSITLSVDARYKNYNYLTKFMVKLENTQK